MFKRVNDEYFADVAVLPVDAAHGGPCSLSRFSRGAICEDDIVRFEDVYARV